MHLDIEYVGDGNRLWRRNPLSIRFSGNLDLTLRQSFSHAVKLVG